MTALYVRTRIWWDQALWRLTKLLSDEQGATVAEYALVLVLVSLAAITVLTTLGDTPEAKITSIITRLQGVQ